MKEAYPVTFQFLMILGLPVILGASAALFWARKSQSARLSSVLSISTAILTPVLFTIIAISVLAIQNCKGFNDFSYYNCSLIPEPIARYSFGLQVFGFGIAAIYAALLVFIGAFVEYRARKNRPSPSPPCRLED